MLMAPLERLSGVERKEGIAKAAMRLFAEHGFHGVTTRQLAEAAGVSEALLYRHFRSKEELYAEIQTACIADTIRVAEGMSALEPSTATLVLALYFINASIIGKCGNAEERDIARLLLASLLSDGEFARDFLHHAFGRFLPKLSECVEAAHAAGDLVEPPTQTALRLTFVHHLAASMVHHSLPKNPAMDYGVDVETMTEEATRFSLRGLGLTQDAIQRYYSPKALALLVAGFGQ